MLDTKTSRFNLDRRVIVITGGAGLLGRQHAMAIAELGGVPVVLDIDSEAAQRVTNEIEETYTVPALAGTCDITDEKSVKLCFEEVLSKRGRIDGLINNAANNEIMGVGTTTAPTSLENFSLEQWDKDFAVGVTGMFICCRVFGSYMAKQRQGVVINISSDLGLISPDQRIYEVPGLPPDEQLYKPISYSVVKHAVIGLTKYLATYWAKSGVRVNALCPGGIYSGHAEEFVEKLTNLIPMGRMATEEEYRGAIQFLCADASIYMTGACLVMDGGRTVW
jgi:NAD(P)-dependent dehydrogenase (short-subunit alcohol dehydrogenase family)